MTSKLQIEANRRNAKRSTGPKTAVGKARSSRNSLRHGLARGQNGDDPTTERLFGLIVSAMGHQAVPNLAMDLARSKLELVQIRSIRGRLLAALLASLETVCVKQLRALDRYERAALAKQKRALRAMPSQREANGQETMSVVGRKAVSMGAYRCLINSGRNGQEV